MVKGLNHKSGKYPEIFFNSLPNDKSLDWSKLKTFSEDKLIVAEIIGFVPEMLQNIVGKGENAGYQNFILFPQYFQNAFSSGSLKVGIVW